MRTSNHVLFTAFLTFASGCLYDGSGTEGLPCHSQADCGEQRCVQGVCGGPIQSEGNPTEDDSDTETDTDMDTDMDMDDASSTGEEPPPPQMLPEPCNPGARRCLGDNALAVCTEDGQLQSEWCQGYCGEGNPVVGGCQTSKLDGIDNCFCQNTGGPPSGTCQQPCSGNFDCSTGEACVNTASLGFVCLPSQCDSCFGAGQVCSSYPESCTFARCEPPG